MENDMATHILRSALISLSFARPGEPSQSSQPIHADSEARLPLWERHPFGRSGREVGNMDPDWIRRHLP